MADGGVSFPDEAAFRQWLARHHGTAGELLLRFFKAHTGRKALTHREAVDQALCFGWIDGVVRRLDDDSYCVRFTPRKAKSYWSDVNVARAAELVADGRMMPAGAAALARHDPARAPRYSFESPPAVLEPEMDRRFRRERGAWTYFQAQPPGYRRVALFWVMRPKRPITREQHLDKLIACSSAGRRLDELVSPTRQTRKT